MTNTDRYGLTISTSSDQAAAHYCEAMDLLLSTWHGTAAAFDAALAADPDFALALAARARVHFIHAEPQMARPMIARAVERAESHGTAREKSHVQILSLTINGKAPQALTNTLAHVDQWPRDALIMSLPLGAFGLFAFSGVSNHDQARVDLCDRYASNYDNDWWFDTYRGWSHTENGNVRFGRDLTERAFAKRSNNANAVHALAHAMFEDGSASDADRLIAGWLPHYDRSAILYSHISWHRALVALERGDAAEALAIYTGHIHPGATEALPINIITDGASFLWRTQLYGHQVPANLWAEVAAYTEQKFPSAGVTFVDVHAAMSAAASGEREALATRLAAIDTKLVAGTLAAGPVVPAICRALQAFADGDFVSCVDTLEPLAHDVVRIGGSHAQREIMEDTLLVALMKAGQTVKARALLDARLHRRPSPRDSAWRVSLPL